MSIQDDTEIESLLPKSLYTTIQHCKDDILRNANLYVSFKTKRYKTITMIYGLFILCCFIGLSISLIVLMPKIIIPYNVLFEKYNTSLTQLLETQTHIQTEFNQVNASISNLFSPVLTNPKWFQLSCFKLCECINEGNSLLCQVVIDFFAIYRTYKQESDYNGHYYLDPCYAQWRWEPYDKECLDLYYQGYVIQQGEGSDNIFDMWNKFYNVEKLLSNINNQVNDVKNIINNKFAGINPDYTLLPLLCCILVGLVVLIIISSLLWTILVHKPFKKEILQSDVKLSDCINSENVYDRIDAYDRIGTLLEIRSTTVPKLRVSTSIEYLTTREEKIRYRWLQNLAFLGGFLRPEATSCEFLQKCGKDIKRKLVLEYLHFLIH